MTDETIKGPITNLKRAMRVGRLIWRHVHDAQNRGHKETDMINDASDHLLFIEPEQAPTAPVIDDYTRRVAAAWRARVDSDVRYRGQHCCTGAGCRATSGNGEHTVAGRFSTNSLAIHYIACHRAEVPAQELAKILTLPPSDVEPTAGELAGDWQACDPQ